MNIKIYILFACTLLILSCKKQDVLLPKSAMSYEPSETEFLKIQKQINDNTDIKIYLDTKQFFECGIDNETKGSAYPYGFVKNAKINNYNQYLVKEPSGEFKRYSFYDLATKNKKFNRAEGRDVLGEFLAGVALNKDLVANVIFAVNDIYGNQIETYIYKDDGLQRPGWVTSSSYIVQVLENVEKPSNKPQDFKQVEQEFVNITKQINNAVPYEIHLNRKVIYSYETKPGKTATAYLYDFKPFGNEQAINFNKFLVRNENGEFKRYMLVDSKIKNRVFTKEEGSEILSNFINDSYIGNAEKENVIVVESDIYGENTKGFGFGKEGGSLRNWGPLNIVQKIEMNNKK